MSLILALAAAAAAQPALTERPAEAPIQVMVVGTYHFDNPGRDLNNPKADDVLKPERQSELAALADALAEFQPTKVMVERVAPEADLIDPDYRDFEPQTLATQRNERVQIGYRVAHRLGHRAVYAIDEQPGEGEPDYFPFGKLAGWAQANGAQAQLQRLAAGGAAVSEWIEQLQAGSIPDALTELNRPEFTVKGQGLYYEALAIGDTEEQPGAELNAMYYLRNAKIFAKLQKVAEPGDRILVVYGSGHSYWLRHFAETVPGYSNVDPVPYLERAAASLR